MSRRRKDDFSKSLVIFSFFLLVVFTAVVLYIFWQTGNEPSTLITAFFAAVLGEFGFLAWIKKTKVQRGGEHDH